MMRLALIQCKECGKEISDRADACPHCGCPTCDGENQRNTNSIPFWLFLIVIIACVVAWFVYLDYETQNEVESVSKPFSDPVPTPVILIEQETQIQEDYYSVYDIELDRRNEVIVEYVINSGPNIDIFFVDETNYFKWKRMMEGAKESNFQYYPQLSTFGTSISTRKSILPSGTYYLILDNTDEGPTYPPMNLENDIATLNIKVIKVNKVNEDN